MLNLDTVIKILGVGIAGFGFLLMYMAYLLIKKIIESATADPAKISIVTRYMLICFAMTLIVGGFTFVSTNYKKDQIDQQSKQIAEKTTAAKILSASNRINLLTDSISKHPTDTANISNAGKEQLKVMDTLAQIFNNTNNPKLIREFAGYQQKMTSLLTANPQKNPGIKNDSAFSDNKLKEYKHYNTLITKLSLNITSN